MRRFPTAAHLVSWAGLCPRKDESAGKRRSTRLRKGAPRLKTAFVQCAWAASRKKDGYLRAQFQRLRQRRGPKKAVCAVAASMLTAIWHMLRCGTFYQDLGADHFHRRSPEQQVQHLASQIGKLGFACTITSQPALVLPSLRAAHPRATGEGRTLCRGAAAGFGHRQPEQCGPERADGGERQERRAVAHPYHNRVGQKGQKLWRGCACSFPGGYWSDSLSPWSQPLILTRCPRPS